MEKHPLRADRRGEDLAAEVLVIGLAEEVEEAVAVEEIDPHARHQRATAGGDPLAVDPPRIGADHVEIRLRLRLLEESLDAPLVVEPHDPQARSGLLVDGDPGDRHVGLPRHVGGEHVGVIHPVELITGEDQDVADVRLLEIADVLPDGVGGALVPAGVVERLLGGEDLDEAAAEGVEGVGPADVAVEADGVELRQDIDPLHPAVDAVGEGDVDDPVLPRQRHGGLRAVAGEGIEPRPAATTEDQSQDPLHAHAEKHPSQRSVGHPPADHATATGPPRQFGFCSGEFGVFTHRARAKPRPPAPLSPVSGRRSSPSAPGR